VLRAKRAAAANKHHTQPMGRARGHAVQREELTTMTRRCREGDRCAMPPKEKKNCVCVYIYVYTLFMWQLFDVSSIEKAGRRAEARRRHARMTYGACRHEEETELWTRGGRTPGG
jgi:hypothetical protein